MKIFVLFATTLLLNAFEMMSQRDSCDIRDMRNSCDCQCIESGYKLVKSHPLTPKSFKKASNYVSYGQFLIKGNTYSIVMCENEVPGKKPIVELFDKDNKLIASSYNSKTKRYYHKMKFQTKQSARYVFRYSFVEESKGCAVSFISVKEQLEDGKD